jgi:preprotein translocase subunit SecB
MAKDKKPEAAKPVPQKAPQAATSASAQGNNAPGIQVVAQYIKDFSFENPNAPESLISKWPTPETNVQIFLRHQPIREDAYECSVNFRIEAIKPLEEKDKGQKKPCFIIDLSYGALVVLQNIPQDRHAPAIMVEVPKLLFPFAREIVANVTSAGGYPPLYLTPISFEAIYLNEVERQKQKTAKG